jgi:hypothetical protein
MHLLPLIQEIVKLVQTAVDETRSGRLAAIELAGDFGQGQSLQMPQNDRIPLCVG